jgi:hypothetical protein
MDASRLVSSAEPILVELRASGFIELERRLAVAVDRAISGSIEQRLASLSEIQGLCNPKALGDMWVKGPSVADWLNGLSALSTIAAHLIQDMSSRSQSKVMPTTGGAL